MRGVWLYFLVFGMLPSIASADERPRTAILRTTASGAADEARVDAIERVLRAKVDELEVIENAGTPALGVADLALAVGCLGETDDCYRAIAAQLEVDALLLSDFASLEDEQVLTVRLFDARSGETITRSATVEVAHGEVRMLERIEPLVRELYGLPPRVTSPSAEVGTRGEEGRRRSPWAFVTAGAGLGALAAGTVLAFRARDKESEYAGLVPNTVAEADEAHRLLDDARRNALFANMLFAAGGALTVTGLILFFVLDRGADRETIEVAPYGAPDGGGLVFSGRFGSLR